MVNAPWTERARILLNDAPGETDRIIPRPIRPHSLSPICDEGLSSMRVVHQFAGTPEGPLDLEGQALTIYASRGHLGLEYRTK